jgi:hypothetical protein
LLQLKLTRAKENRKEKYNIRLGTSRRMKLTKNQTRKENYSTPRKTGS